MLHSPTAPAWSTFEISRFLFVWNLKCESLSANKFSRRQRLVSKTQQLVGLWFWHRIVRTNKAFCEARSTSWICPTCTWLFSGCLQSLSSAHLERGFAWISNSKNLSHDVLSLWFLERVSPYVIASFPHFYPFHSISASYKAGKLLGPILVAAVQTAAEQILQSFVVPGSSLMWTVIWNAWA